MPQQSIKRFGRLPKKSDFRTLRFSDYVKRLPIPPQSYDTLARVYQGTQITDPTQLFPMDSNDQYGDCTIAALAHATTVYQAMIGHVDIMAAAEVEKVYFGLTGGEDTGLNELDVLKYWRTNAPGGHEILAFVGIDPKNHTHVKQAIQYFGGVYIGFQVQTNALPDFDAHIEWTPGTLLNDGHAVYAVSYDVASVQVLTWGAVQQGTWAWWDECVQEAYAILPDAATSAVFCPGFDIAQLQSDLQQVAA